MTLLAYKIECDRCGDEVTVPADVAISGVLATVRLPDEGDNLSPIDHWCERCVGSFKRWRRKGRRD